MTNPKDNVSKDHAAGFGLLVASAAILIAAVLGLYFWKFGNFPFSNQQEVWGQFGDYVGGLLNSGMAFLAFLTLLLTLKLQKEELANSREELRKSSAALQQQLEHYRIQAVLSDIRAAIDNTEAEINATINSFVMRGNGSHNATYRDSILNETNAVSEGCSLVSKDALESMALKRGTNEAIMAIDMLQNINYVSVYLERLARLLFQYECNSHSDYYVFSVKANYSQIFSNLLACGFLGFEVTAYMKQWPELPVPELKDSEPFKTMPARSGS